MRTMFEPGAWKDYTSWATKQDIRVLQQLNRLIEAIQRDPYDGIGDPEPLRNNLSGYWSRRITREHRLVYMIEGDQLIIIQCREHY